MGFKFGVLTELDFKVTLYCFVLVVAFVIGAEYVLGILEYFLEGSRLYSQMIEKIYKELMLMGMLTFCVMMYEAVPRDEANEIEHEWMEAIDFSHVYLFFVTFFFVMHAFYLMAKSVSAVSEYRLMYSERTELMIEGLQNLKSSWWGTFLFNLKMLPFCNTRNHVEFSLTQSLFTKLYRLPEDVDFPYYLSGCFDRFALRTINRSMFTWVVLLFFVALNYASIRYNLTGEVFRVVYTYLEIPLSEAEATGRKPYSPQDVMFIFAVCGVLLVLYTFILTLITRIYKARLVDRVYPDHSSIDDYIQLLRAKQREQAHPNPHNKEIRISAAKLKREIEVEFDEKEEGEVEDEEGIKYLAELIRGSYKWAKEAYSDTVLYVKVKLHDGICCCVPEDRLARRQSLLGEAMPQKRVVEQKSHYVPLKRRLKLSFQERHLLAGAATTSAAETDGLILGGARGRSNYGATSNTSSNAAGAGASVYSAVHRTDSADETDALRRSVERAEDARGHDCSNQLCCCACCGSEWEHDINLNSIFCGGKPIWYFRAVELQIMFTCMYMGLWATNLVTMVRAEEDFSPAQEIGIQLLMLVPIVVAFHRIAYIAETYSLIMAICELDIEALYDVLVNTEDMAVVSDELRRRIQDKICAWCGTDTPSEQQERMFVHLLFEEVDQDCSGAIDKGEFRQMLRELNLSYSDHRFNLLFRAVDSIGGDGTVEEADLLEFMFPSHATSVSDSGSSARNEGSDGEAEDHIDAPSRHKGPGTHSWADPDVIEEPHHHPHHHHHHHHHHGHPAPSAGANANGAVRDNGLNFTNVSPRELESLRASVRASSAMEMDRNFVCTVKSSKNENSWMRNAK